MKLIKDIAIRILLFIIFIVFLICTHILMTEHQENKDSIEIIEQLKEDTIKENTNSREKTIDWEKLKNINKDIIGWIEIPDTNIDYPLLKDNSNLFYLNHSFNKSTNENGSIFTLNNSHFIEKETIIYGHNRLNGIMFSELSKYLQKNFFDKHLEFNIFTPEKNFKAKVFSVYSINNFTEKNNLKELSFNEQIDYYKSKSKYEVETDNIQKIVKLSTCSYLNNRKRVTEERYYIIASLEEMNLD